MIGLNKIAEWHWTTSANSRPLEQAQHRSDQPNHDPAIVTKIEIPVPPDGEQRRQVFSVVLSSGGRVVRAVPSSTKPCLIQFEPHCGSALFRGGHYLVEHNPVRTITAGFQSVCARCVDWRAE